MKIKLIVATLLMIAISLTAQVTTIPLNGTWDIFDAPKSEFQITGEIPGTLYEALLKHDKIEDPFYGTNEQNQDDILLRDWTFARKFSLTPEMLNSQALFLCFDGIDTIADIKINDKLILHANNMHRKWRIDLKEVGLEAGEHNLEILIYSPKAFAYSQYKKHGVSLMQGNALGTLGTPFTRKAWYSFGWDWGAEIPDSGIWKDCYIKAINKAEIKDAQIITEIQFNDYKNFSEIVAEKADLTINLRTTQYDTSALTATATLSGFGEKIIATKEFSPNEANSSLSLSIDKPNLWWTHELGKPNLYTIKVELSSNGLLLDTYEQKYGFRTIELVRDNDKQGQTFYFKLNNVPIFAKGANWIPCDTFIPRGMKKGLLEERFADAVAANFNMIRVWGGGIYETDEFYDLADENGILIWQDFAFACYAVPNLEDYLANVQVEVDENVIRLRNRTSLALWCGNNEIDEAWHLWGYVLMFPQHKPANKRLFKEMIPASIAKLDPTRTYWPTSPYSGESGAAPNSPNYGDSHYWAVWHGGLPISAYRKFPTRFMSEFGFESFPDMKTIQEFAEPSDYNFTSKVMETHQKNGAGNRKIMAYMKKEFSIPKTFEKQVTVSQLTQAEAMQYGIDTWRKRRHDFGSMGSLFWQFNDTWPVASWSSVDYFGRWKALQYFAKRIFAPAYCSVMESPKDGEMWIVNDYREDKNFTVKWSVQGVDGTIYESHSQEILAPAADSFLFKTVDIRRYRKGLSRGHLVLFWEILNEEGKTESRGHKLFHKPKYFKVKQPTFTTEVTEISPTEFSVQLSSSENAIYTHFNTPFDFTASDNFFHLIQNEPYEVTFKTWNEMTLDEFKAGLKVESYYELLH